MLVGAFIFSLWINSQKEEEKVARIIDAVVDTYSLKERKELIEYVSSKEKFLSVISDFDSFSLIGISNGVIGLLGVLCAQAMVKDGQKHFLSVADYIKACEEQK